VRGTRPRLSPLRTRVDCTPSRVGTGAGRRRHGRASRRYNGSASRYRGHRHSRCRGCKSCPGHRCCTRRRCSEQCGTRSRPRTARPPRRTCTSGYQPLVSRSGPDNRRCYRTHRPGCRPSIGGWTNKRTRPSNRWRSSKGCRGNHWSKPRAWSASKPLAGRERGHSRKPNRPSNRRSTGRGCSRLRRRRRPGSGQARAGICRMHNAPASCTLRPCPRLRSRLCRYPSRRRTHCCCSRRRRNTPRPRHARCRCPSVHQADARNSAPPCTRSPACTRVGRSKRRAASSLVHPARNTHHSRWPSRSATLARRRSGPGPDNCTSRKRMHPEPTWRPARAPDRRSCRASHAEAARHRSQRGELRSVARQRARPPRRRPPTCSSHRAARAHVRFHTQPRPRAPKQAARFSPLQVTRGFIGLRAGRRQSLEPHAGRSPPPFLPG